MAGESTSPSCVVLRPEDNIAVACRDLAPGEDVPIPGGAIKSVTAVPIGHKISTGDIPAGAEIRKFGQVIGFASEAISPGQHVHVHNCAADSFDRDYAFASETPPAPPEHLGRTFKGFLRQDGRVGTRNYLAVISTVNCSASTSKYICSRITPDILAGFPNVDGVLPLTHKSGCGMQEDGLDHEQLNRVLSGFASHPNIGAYLLVGLGCEVGQASHLIRNSQLVQVDGLEREEKDVTGCQPPTITIQEQGGVSATIEAGVEAVLDLLPKLDRIERSDQPVSRPVAPRE